MVSYHGRDVCFRAGLACRWPQFRPVWSLNDFDLKKNRRQDCRFLVFCNDLWGCTGWSLSCCNHQVNLTISFWPAPAIYNYSSKFQNPGRTDLRRCAFIWLYKQQKRILYSLAVIGGHWSVSRCGCLLSSYKQSMMQVRQRSSDIESDHRVRSGVVKYVTALCCFNSLSGVDSFLSVFQVQRPHGSPYTTHEINKGHPNLAATPPGHSSSPGLSQVSVSTVSTAHLYHPKSWEPIGGVSAHAQQPESFGLSAFVCLCV